MNSLMNYLFSWYCFDRSYEKAVESAYFALKCEAAKSELCYSCSEREKIHQKNSLEAEIICCVSCLRWERDF
ncbi:hypothetical protein T4E_1634 [Trichinella pseudospiralis]|uniref:Uncharacterized protein n=1 Tax=Trichinella pseudospiralis TaxID=6337 RepID=A0A0V0XKY7_TRIPS|nr:hypothetical protein T4E_8462 [Trichinella pseudospiralis]KRX88639.1 hypothetical protein T4E_1634 [Trichinella pseudospiralis]